MIGPDFPLRRVDVFREAVRTMVMRQRRRFDVPFVTLNEVHAHLEYLAYKMRECAGRTYIPEALVIGFFEELRGAEPDEAELRIHQPSELLNAIIHTVGLLQIVGEELDDRGFIRKQIGFTHQLFQEYFAAQAILHQRGTISDTLYGRIATLLRRASGDWNLTERHIQFPGRQLTEPVVAEQWQEVLPLAIAALGKTKHHVIDAALRCILAPPDAPDDVRRACGTLALRVLGDEPDASNDCVEEVLEAAIDSLRYGDGNIARPGTLMAEAIARVSRTRYGPQLRNRLIQRFCEVREEKQWVARSAAIWPEETVTPETAVITFYHYLDGLSCSDTTRQLDCALRLHSLLFEEDRYNVDRFELISPDLPLEIFNRLTELAVACDFQPLRLTVIGLISWLLGAWRDKPTGIPRIDAHREILFLKLMESLDPDDITQSHIASIISHRGHHSDFFASLDWLLEWELVGEGTKPHSQLPIPKIVSRITATNCLQWSLRRATSRIARCGISIALGRMGVFCEEMVQPLAFQFNNGPRHTYDRDEALVYLVHVKCQSVTNHLFSAANSPLDARYERDRGVSGLIGQGDPLVLERALREFPFAVKQFANCLAGIADPLGREILRDFADQSGQTIRKTAIEALHKAEAWGLA
jgi:hypothetical protein